MQEGDMGNVGKCWIYKGFWMVMWGVEMWGEIVRESLKISGVMINII